MNNKKWKKYLNEAYVSHELCNEFSFSNGFITNTGTWLESHGLSHTRLAFEILESFDINWLKIKEKYNGPDYYLIDNLGYIRVANAYNYSGPYPTDIEEGIWSEQINTMKELLKKCMEENNWHEDKQLDQIPNLRYESYDGNVSIEEKATATGFARFFKGLRLAQRGQKLATSALSQWRENRRGFIDPEGDFIETDEPKELAAMRILQELYGSKWEQKILESKYKSRSDFIIYELGYIRVDNSYKFEGKEIILSEDEYWSDKIKTMKMIFENKNSTNYLGHAYTYRDERTKWIIWESSEEKFMKSLVESRSIKDKKRSKRNR